MTKIVRFAPTDPLFNVISKFPLLFLTSIVLHSFLKIGTTLNHREGEILYMFKEITFFRKKKIEIQRVSKVSVTDCQIIRKRGCRE